MNQVGTYPIICLEETLVLLHMYNFELAHKTRPEFYIINQCIAHGIEIVTIKKSLEKL